MYTVCWFCSFMSLHNWRIRFLVGLGFGLSYRYLKQIVYSWHGEQKVVVWYTLQDLVVKILGFVSLCVYWLQMGTAEGNLRQALGHPS